MVTSNVGDNLAVLYLMKLWSQRARCFRSVTWPRNWRSARAVRHYHSLGLVPRSKTEGWEPEFLVLLAFQFRPCLTPISDSAPAMHIAFPNTNYTHSTSPELEMRCAFNPMQRRLVQQWNMMYMQVKSQDHMFMIRKDVPSAISYKNSTK